MKTKSTIKKLALLFILLPLFALSQKYEVSDKFVKEFDVSSTASIDFESKMGALEVKTGSSGKAKLECFYEIKGNNEDDIEKVEKAIREMDIRNSDMKLSINASIFKKYNRTVIGFISTIKGWLHGGDVVKIKGFDIKYILTVPDNHELSIKQKYNDLSIADYHGNSKRNAR